MIYTYINIYIHNNYKAYTWYCIYTLHMMNSACRSRSRALGTGARGAHQCCGAGTSPGEGYHMVPHQNHIAHMAHYHFTQKSGYADVFSIFGQTCSVVALTASNALCQCVAWQDLT